VLIYSTSTPLSVKNVRGSVNKETYRIHFKTGDKGFKRHTEYNATVVRRHGARHTRRWAVGRGRDTRGRHRRHVSFPHRVVIDVILIVLQKYPTNKPLNRRHSISSRAFCAALGCLSLTFTHTHRNNDLCDPSASGTQSTSRDRFPSREDSR
jgi:hypothetical protein